MLMNLKSNQMKPLSEYCPVSGKPERVSLSYMYIRTCRTVIAFVVFLAAAGIMAGCEEEMESNANEPAIPLLSKEGTNLKAPGKGQYRLAALSGDEVTVSALLPSDVQSLTITKTVNLEIDQAFGSNGVMTVDGSSLNESYDFVYAPPVTDIDELVGFTFTATRANGSTVVSDLTLVVTLSPRDNIPFRRWNLVSRLWVDNGNSEDLKDCEKDNYYLFNGDGTMSLNYGTDTGTGACGFDGFNVYETWELTENEELFIMTRYGIFSPDVKETETYRVVKLTTDEIVLDIDLDLSVFGLSTEETFRYFLDAAPK